jgi:gamma-glutamylcyclotransferase (GGCT)/AIG2-like uncharacterized protein YtfP
MEPLFVYGTLKEPSIQKRVIWREIQGTPEVLESFAIYKVKLESKVYPMIVRKVGSEVSGLAIYVTAEELKRIDYYETEAYARQEVTLKSGKDTWVYLEPC